VVVIHDFYVSLHAIPFENLPQSWFAACSTAGASCKS